MEVFLYKKLEVKQPNGLKVKEIWQITQEAYNTEINHCNSRYLLHTQNKQTHIDKSELDTEEKLRNKTVNIIKLNAN